MHTSVVTRYVTELSHFKLRKPVLLDILTKKHVILKLLWIAFYVRCLKCLEIYTELAATEQNLVYQGFLFL